MTEQKIHKLLSKLYREELKATLAGNYEQIVRIRSKILDLENTLERLSKDQ